MVCLRNILIAKYAERAVAIQPFDRLTALSGVEGLDYVAAPLSGRVAMARLEDTL